MLACFIIWYAADIYLLYILWIVTESTNIIWGCCCEANMFVWDYCLKSNIFDAAVLRQYIWNCCTEEKYIWSCCVEAKIFLATLTIQIYLRLLLWGKCVWGYSMSSIMFESAVLRQCIWAAGWSQVCLRLLCWGRHIWSYFVHIVNI